MVYSHFSSREGQLLFGNRFSADPSSLGVVCLHKASRSGRLFATYAAESRLDQL